MDHCAFERLDAALVGRPALTCGRFSGWSLYVKDSVPAYDDNFLGLQRFTFATKEMRQADKAVEDKLRAETAHQKAMSD